MQTLALTLSIIASALLIVYLLMLIFGRKEPDTITIRGCIVTQTVTTAFNNGEDIVTGRTIEQK